MPKFEVLIMETLEDIVTVEAENEQEALCKVEDAWKNGEYILDSENFTGVEFKLWKDSLFKVWTDEIDRYLKGEGYVKVKIKKKE